MDHSQSSGESHTPAVHDRLVVAMAILILLQSLSHAQTPSGFSPVETIEEKLSQRIGKQFVTYKVVYGPAGL